MNKKNAHNQIDESFIQKNYKAIYHQITPSDLLIQAVRHPASRQQKTNFRLQYVAFAAITILLLGGGSVYAATHIPLIRDFFGENISKEVSNELYHPVEQFILCDGYVFTLEGYVYTPEVGTGYLSIRINRTDGSVPVIKWGPSHEYAYTNENNQTTCFYSGSADYLIDGQTFSIFLSPSDFHNMYTHIAESEDSVSLYYKFYNRTNVTDYLNFYVATQENVQNLWDRQTAGKEEIESFENFLASNLLGITIDISNVNDYVVSFSDENYEIAVSQMDLYIRTEYDSPDSLALIEKDGNRIEIIKDEKILYVPEQWAGPLKLKDEDGTTTLYYTFQKPVDPSGVQIELNGIIIN